MWYQITEYVVTYLRIFGPDVTSRPLAVEIDVAKRLSGLVKSFKRAK